MRAAVTLLAYFAGSSPAPGWAADRLRPVTEQQRMQLRGLHHVAADRRDVVQAPELHALLLGHRPEPIRRPARSRARPGEVGEQRDGRAHRDLSLDPGSAERRSARTAAERVA